MSASQYSFTLYLGSGKEGESYDAKLERGQKRHRFRSRREYILYAIDKLDKDESVKKPVQKTANAA